MTCPRAKRCVDGNECWCPGFMVDELWEGLNLSSSKKTRLSPILGTTINSNGFATKNMPDWIFSGENVKNFPFLDQNSALGPKWEESNCFFAILVKTRKSEAKTVQRFSDVVFGSTYWLLQKRPTKGPDSTASSGRVTDPSKRALRGHFCGEKGQFSL